MQVHGWQAEHRHKKPTPHPCRKVVAHILENEEMIKNIYSESVDLHFKPSEKFKELLK